MNNAALNERAQHVLRVLVERYIQDGQPIGSKTIATEASVAMSPATIRNVMSDLEEAGFIHSPHTSAGRVPTAQGYRLFVDSLLTIKPLEKMDVSELEKNINQNVELPQLMQSASSLLSRITKLTGLVTIPKREKLILHHVEFLPLSNNRVLVILVLNDKEVQNRIIHTDKNYQRDELLQASNYLNAEYAGKDLSLIRQDLLSTMQKMRQEVNTVMKTIIDVAEEVFTPDEEQSDYVLSGESNLISASNEEELTQLQSLFETFAEKQKILELLDHCLNADGVQLFIGEESGINVFDNYSLVTAPYSVEGDVVGMLGVIGPKRMAYDRIIPAVDITAKLLSAALNQE